MLSDLKPLVEPAASLAHYTAPGLIVPKLLGRDAAGIIHELCQAMHREGCMPDILPFYHTALNHELLFNSVLESGIAVPHARLTAIRRLQFAFGRTPEPVTWGARSGRAVDQVFLIAVPATDAASYLHLLASIARIGARPELLKALHQAASIEDLLEVLGGVTIA